MNCPVGIISFSFFSPLLLFVFLCTYIWRIMFSGDEHLWQPTWKACMYKLVALYIGQRPEQGTFRLYLWVWVLEMNNGHMAARIGAGTGSGSR